MLSLLLVCDVCAGAHMPWWMCRGQRMILWSRFFPCTFIWVLGIKRRLPGCSVTAFTHWTISAARDQYSRTDFKLYHVFKMQTLSMAVGRGPDGSMKCWLLQRKRQNHKNQHQGKCGEQLYYPRPGLCISSKPPRVSISIVSTVVVNDWRSEPNNNVKFGIWALWYGRC